VIPFLPSLQHGVLLGSGAQADAAMDAESLKSATTMAEQLSTTVAASAMAASSALASADEIMSAKRSSTWLGLIGKLILAALQLVFAISYWIVRLVTIKIPTFLFAMFSASWTVTMNATTL
jgi:lysophospholipid hydrolase